MWLIQESLLEKTLGLHVTEVSRERNKSKTLGLYVTEVSKERNKSLLKKTFRTISRKQSR